MKQPALSAASPLRRPGALRFAVALLARHDLHHCTRGVERVLRRTPRARLLHCSNQWFSVRIAPLVRLSLSEWSAVAGDSSAPSDVTARPRDAVLTAGYRSIERLVQRLLHTAVHLSMPPAAAVKSRARVQAAREVDFAQRAGRQAPVEMQPVTRVLRQPVAKAAAIPAAPSVAAHPTPGCNGSRSATAVAPPGGPEAALDLTRLRQDLTTRSGAHPGSTRHRPSRTHGADLVMALEKAIITNTVTGVQTPVMFNPEDYTVNRENNFAQAAIPGLSAPILQFVHGNMQTLEMELFLDTYEQHTVSSRVLNNARDGCAHALGRTHGVDGHRCHHPRAARVAVHLGSAVLHLRAGARQPAIHDVPAGRHAGAGQVQVTFNEFRNVDLEAKEIKRETSDFSKRYVVGQGETLATIAWAHFGDPRDWRPIALANAIDDPRRGLTRGNESGAAATALPGSGHGEGVYVMNVASLRYIPDFRLDSTARRFPRRCAPSITSIKHETGLEGADRVEITLVNEHLRWLDNPLFALDTVACSIAWLCARTVGADVRRRGGGAVRRLSGQRTAHGDGGRRRTAANGCSRETNCAGLPFRYPRSATSAAGFGDCALVSLENLLIPIIDPVGAAIAVLLGGIEAIGTISDPSSAQKFIRKEAERIGLRVSVENCRGERLADVHRS